MDALTQYAQKMQKIAIILEALTVWAEDMGGISPDNVRKTHVDDLDEILKRVRGAAIWAGIEEGKSTCKWMELQSGDYVIGCTREVWFGGWQAVCPKCKLTVTMKETSK